MEFLVHLAERGARRLFAALAVSIFLIHSLNVLTSASVQGSDDISAPVSGNGTAAPLPADGESVLSQSAYLKQWPDAVASPDTIVIPADRFAEDSGEGVRQILPEYENMPGNSALLDDTQPVSYRFHVETAGLYTIRFYYYTGSQTGSAATRAVRIDGAVPFAESADIAFTQLWMDADLEKQYDQDKNEIRSRQIQRHQWHDTCAEDVSGKTDGPLQYYLTAGAHTLTLVPQNECLLLNRIVLAGKTSVPDYAQVKESYKDKEHGSRHVSRTVALSIEAESGGVLKSDQTLVPLNDRTSPAVTPYDVSLVRYNSIGAGQWQVVHQWLEWTVTVPETGLYQLGAHFKQNIKTDDVSMRELTIDGELPFREAASLRFAYGGAWQTCAFADENGEPFLFYLEKGSHTLRLRATLGDAAVILDKADRALAQLNDVYRKIVVITGTKADPYANYQFDKTIPETLAAMRTLYTELNAMAEEISAFSGRGGASTAAVRRLIAQLKIMTDDSDKIASHLQSFRDNISSLGTWINEFKSQPLQLDALYVYSPNAPLPAGESGFLRRVGHLFSQFFWSFFRDYEAIGMTGGETGAPLRVWIASGRDQAHILRQMTSDGFTPDRQVTINLQLVTATALLPSIVAGNNPDVYIGAPQADPINLALRDAVLDLSRMEGFSALADELFSPATLVPFTLNEAVYALPDAMDYPMLFVRSDILRELGIATEDLQDWDTILLKVLPVLQMNSLSMGVPVAIQSFMTFLYQYGGSLYEADGKTSALATAQAISAMERYTELYTQYGLSLAYDFANRFRSGEMPVALANFTSYNQLSVFAPDIRGQWTMLPVPGIRRDGVLDRSATATVTGSMILSGTERPDACWEFLKWWTSTDVQQEYSMNLESLIGSAARYNTANIRALSNAAWDRGMKSSLLAQLEDIQPYTEVPGGYLTSRYYDFSFRNIVYDGDNVRDTMLEAADSINTEIAHKRREYFLE